MPDQLGQYAKMQQLQAGQQQMRTGALQEQSAGMQLQQLKEDRANMAKLSQQLSAKGIGPRQYFEALQSSGDTKYQQLGIEGLMKLDQTEKYDAFLRSQQTIPAQQASAPMAGGLGTGTFGLDTIPGMPNALASQAAAPMAATNALAPQAASPIAALEGRIAELQTINDPRAQAEAARLQKQVDQYNQPYAVGGNLVTGGGKTLFTAPEKPAAPPAMVAEYTFAKTPDGGNFKGSYQDFVTARAAAQRAPATPATPAAPVQVVDPVTGKPVFVSREEALSGRMTPAASMESLPPKEIQKREAALPQATSSIKGFESKADKFVADLTALRDDPGLENITGPIFGRTGSVTREGSRAQALYDKIVAKGGFQALQDLRDASKTGGALGNVSNQEGKQLTASFAAIDRRQNAEDVRAAINQAIADIEGSKTRMREAYDSTYSYKSGGTPAPAARKPAAGNAVDTSNPLLK
jgi:hypothetical protein